MTGWLPRFVCPACRAAVERPTANSLACGGCGRSFERHDGIWEFLVESSAARLESFAIGYRRVRAVEGRRRDSADYYRALPWVPAADPTAGDWRVRRETYRHLLSHVLAGGPQPSAVLDLGAGSGWLSHRLSTLGHRVVAVDALADDADGLGAIRHYPTPVVAVRADFDALPLAPAQFDVVVFNGSLHYAPDAAASLAAAHRMLVPGGTLVVMDSPMFRADRDGAAMAANTKFTHPGRGYLTFASLAASAGALDMKPEFVPSRGPLGWRVRRHLSRVRLRRQPAAFGLWVAR